MKTAKTIGSGLAVLAVGIGWSIWQDQVIVLQLLTFLALATAFILEETKRQFSQRRFLELSSIALAGAGVGALAADGEVSLLLMLVLLLLASWMVYQNVRPS